MNDELNLNEIQKELYAEIELDFHKSIEYHKGRQAGVDMALKRILSLYGEFRDGKEESQPVPDNKPGQSAEDSP